MDETEIYIKMCEKAGEIQVEREATIGNFYYDKFDQEAYCLGAMRKDGTHEFIPLKVSLEDSIRYIWLPRQDQLQAMVLPLKENDLAVLHLDFNIFVEYDCIMRLGDYRLREYKSYEQLWLAFCMFQLYQKKWVNDDWVKIDD